MKSVVFSFQVLSPAPQKLAIIIIMIEHEAMNALAHFRDRMISYWNDMVLNDCGTWMLLNRYILSKKIDGRKKELDLSGVTRDRVYRRDARRRLHEFRWVERFAEKFVRRCPSQRAEESRHSGGSRMSRHWPALTRLKMRLGALLHGLAHGKKDLPRQLITGSPIPVARDVPDRWFRLRTGN